MAYPLAQMPTLGAFIEVAKSEGITDGLTDAEATGPRGPVRFHYLRRGTETPVILPNIDDSERLTPVVLSNLCRRLAIDPQKFGLDIGLLPPEH